jgi:steroid delta-isomerase-like uncharacterized protein
LKQAHSVDAKLLKGLIMEIPQVVRTYIETFNPKALDAWIATFAPDGTYSDPGIPTPTPAHSLKEHFTGLFVGFPDMTAETLALDPLSEQDWVWRWVFHGTNTGSFRGLPPTGHRVAMPGCEFIEIRDDYVHRVVGYYDRLTMLSQLGLGPNSPSKR